MLIIMGFRIIRIDNYDYITLTDLERYKNQKISSNVIKSV